MTRRSRRPTAEWREELSPTAYEGPAQGATERPFTNDHMETVDGVYRCGGLQDPLFSAETKFESGSGWPVVHRRHRSPGAVELKATARCS
jgi:peptide-methionine (R)-S-oxide reductase